MIGVGGTGKTFLLESWASELADDGSQVNWLRPGPARPVSAAEVTAALDGADALAVDDVHWFDADALRALLAAADAATILAARRPVGRAAGAEIVDLLDAVDDALSRSGPATRLGLVALDDFAPVLAGIRAAQVPGATGALASEEVEAVHVLSAGSAGLAADLVQSSWDRQTAPPADVVDAVQRRVRRSGSGAVALVGLWALALQVQTDDAPADASPGDGPRGDDALAIALQALPEDVDATEAERAARSGGLVDDGGALIAVVARTTVIDLPQAERAQGHDALGAVLADRDVVRAARHLRRGTGSTEGSVGVLGRAALELSSTEPEESEALIDRAEQWGLPAADVSFLRGLGAFRVGSGRALAHLDQLEQGLDDDAQTTSGDAALLGYGLDMRELRFDAATERVLDGELAPPLRRMAATVIGSSATAEGSAPTTALGRLLATTAQALTAVATGHTANAVGGFAAAADDFDRLRPPSPLGFTPHQLGALGAVVLGDLPAAATLTAQAETNGSGGPGETLTHQLLGAYGALMGGDYGPTLDLLRVHAPEGAKGLSAGAEDGGPTPAQEAAAAGTDPDAHLAQRDRLLLAALEAAIARRSGDTGRLRTAWARAEQALLRPSTSWLYADFLVEILACGARLDAYDRTTPIVQAVLEQTAELPADGPAPVMGQWLRLQVAIAADDHDEVEAAAEVMAKLLPNDRRSRARVAAAGAWADVMARTADEESLGPVADALMACGENWEASRLLGQAALDEADPQAARRLLERARATGVDSIEEGTTGGLASLGLSEREAEVAVLVAEGRTHKEIGAQLYISPKTVEHHVAKIRQKLGATSRAELLSIVREAVG
ncbi:MAG: helix-turn-helix transcriptional regulator [Actinomycetota bacterium]